MNGHTNINGFGLVRVEQFRLQTASPATKSSKCAVAALSVGTNTRGYNVSEQRNDRARLAKMRETDLSEDWEVAVCDKCLYSSCWLGEFMCDDAYTAGTVTKTVAELRELNREHPSWWAAEARARVGVK